MARYRILVELPTAHERWFVVEDELSDGEAREEVAAYNKTGYAEMVEDGE